MKDDVVILPSNAVSAPERTESVNIANLEEADLSPQVAATGEDRLSKLSPQEQALVHVISLSRLPLPTLLTHSYQPMLSKSLLLHPVQSNHLQESPSSSPTSNHCNKSPHVPSRWR